MRLDETVRRLLADVLFNESQRTAKVIEIMRERHAIKISPPVVRAMALALGVVLERGPEEGQSKGGRPPGSRDSNVRRVRSDRGTSRLTGESVDVLAEKARVSYKRTQSMRATARELGVSPEYVRQLLLRPASDGK